MPTVSAEKRIRLLNEYKRSGKSQSEFCRERGISPQTFSSWLHGKKKNAIKQKPVSFVPAEKKRAVEGTRLEIIFGDGTTVRISGSV